MSAPPLTHHEIVRRASPLTVAGLRVRLSACDRARRYIEFEAQPGPHESVTIVYSLTLPANGKQRLERVLLHTKGLVSVLSAPTDDLIKTFEGFETIPLSRQLTMIDGYTIARSYSVPTPSNSGDNFSTSLRLRFVIAQVNHLQLRVDASTGGGMPADVWVMQQGAPETYLRDTLADGSRLPLHHPAAQQLRLRVLSEQSDKTVIGLPDDLLAVLGPQWRPLRWQGDHWKGVLRQLGNRETRTSKAESYIEGALSHIDNTLRTSPIEYHAIQAKARWKVWGRRLKPVLLLVGILALMPITWFLVSTGALSVHPLASGLAPLLMVGAIVLSAREIPIMEIPPTPRALPENAWTPTTAQTPTTHQVITPEERAGL